MPQSQLHSHPDRVAVISGRTAFHAWRRYKESTLTPLQATDTAFTRRTASQYIYNHKDDFIAFLPSINGEDSVGATEHDGIMTDQEFGKYCQLIAESGEWGGEPEVSVFSMFSSGSEPRVQAPPAHIGCACRTWRSVSGQIGVELHYVTLLSAEAKMTNTQIQALSRAYNVPIHVIQSGPPTVVSHGSIDDTFGGGLTPEASAKEGDRVVRISYHRRMYGLGEVSGLEISALSFIGSDCRLSPLLLHLGRGGYSRDNYAWG